MKYELWDLLKSLKENYEIVDLSHPVSPETPHWSGFEPMEERTVYNFEEEDYLEVWDEVQLLNITREYLKANPNQKVNIYLYTPSVGAGDQFTWKCIIFLKK